MDLLNCLKYVLPLTILFDAVVSLLLVRKSLHDKVIRYYCLALVTLVVWEIIFWLSIFVQYEPAHNNLIDRLMFTIAILSQYLMLNFLLSYLKIKFSKALHLLITMLIALIALVILIFGVGDRQYIGVDSHQYFLGNDIYSSTVLAIYSFISIAVTLACFYSLTKMISAGLSAFEIARRRIIRNSIGFSLLVTLIPLAVLPLIVLLSSGSLSETLASDWYIVTIVLAAIFSSVWTAATAYALTRYRLFDVTVRIRRSVLLIAGILILTTTIVGLDQFVLKIFFDNTVQIMALIVLLVSGFVVMIWYTRKVGFGEPISIALLEPVQQNASIQELAGKLQHYLADEFNITANGTYLFDITTKQFAHANTGVVINLPSELIQRLKQKQIINEQLPQVLKPAIALLPLTYNDFLIGFTATSKTIKGDVQKNLQPFVGLIYQAMFASYLKKV